MPSRKLACPVLLILSVTLAWQQTLVEGRLPGQAIEGQNHLEQNSVLRQLLGPGVALAPGATAPLPTPRMADGLSAADQRRVIEQWEGRQADVDELLRRSPVTPFLLHFREIEAGPASAAGRAIDLGFVTYGRFDDLARSDFLEEMLNSGRKDAAIQPLTPESVAHLHLEPVASEAARTGWAHVSLTLMDRVTLRGTSRTVWSRTAESVVVAAVLEPRCTGSREFPNAWQLLERDDAGQLRPKGPAVAYEALGYYLKITRLAEPADALFVEWHLIFREPQEWFDGANLLRSKLPIVLQTKIRAFRRELMRTLGPG
ncbi:MAG TPA: hypothetical protein PKD86_17380 [Gemmatales bacterium]|nr:hypothetical protein [Gemmatales bacterium]HMP61118.1 hypothetical protein [Gemmatales bacterium]